MAQTRTLRGLCLKRHTVMLLWSTEKPQKSRRCTHCVFPLPRLASALLQSILKGGQEQMSLPSLSSRIQVLLDQAQTAALCSPPPRISVWAILGPNHDLSSDLEFPGSPHDRSFKNWHNIWLLSNFPVRRLILVTSCIFCQQISNFTFEFFIKYMPFGFRDWLFYTFLVNELQTIFLLSPWFNFLSRPP